MDLEDLAVDDTCEGALFQLDVSRIVKLPDDFDPNIIQAHTETLGHTWFAADPCGVNTYGTWKTNRPQDE